MPIEGTLAPPHTPLPHPWRWRRIGTLAAALVFLVGLIIFGVNVGAVSIPPQDVVAILLGGGSPEDRAILWNLRLPRILVGALVGIGMATSGAVLQAVLRNPLADPGLIGVSAGAGLVAVAVMIVAPQWMSLIPWGAFVGALAATFLVMGLAWGVGGLSPLRLVLAGVALNALLGALMGLVMMLYADRVPAILGWTLGSLSGRSWPELTRMLPLIVLGAGLAVGSARFLTMLLLQDEVVRGLGLAVAWVRLWLVSIAALSAAGAVSATGLIGFVGLVTPHMARLLVGPDHRFLLPTAALLGAGLVVAADTLARIVAAPLELPMGSVLALVGAPYFLYLLWRGARWRSPHI
jgi:iron complex transport system permease protein